MKILIDMTHLLCERILVPETPEVAAAIQRIREALTPVFQGFFFEVSGERGLTAEFARRIPNAGPLTRLQAPAYAKLIITPSNESWRAGTKVRLLPADQATKETIENHKLTFRKQLGVDGKKAVDYLIGWFKTNADALKGQGPDQGPWLVR